ncbi:hypothetical protein BBJ28_00018599 [Nothophytophthora sp. Chile5]|nr:hypothetical protein BBJ28_00018599 [Nothophytophthora sp. Chile5]
MLGVRGAAAELPASQSTEETFLQAEHFVAVVLSRLEKDPLSVAPRLWGFQQQPTANRLWAFKQQALVGSCEASRGSKTHGESDAFFPSKPNRVWTFSCCQFVAGDSKLKLWQELRDMPADEAQREYIRVCRRCLNLVCAVCSPHAMPLRVFSQSTSKRQRVCAVCFDEIREVERTSSIITTSSSTNQVREATATATDTPSVAQDTQETATTAAPVDSPPVSTAAIHLGTLEFLQGAYGAGAKVFRKTWRSFFFVLLVRKGSLGMFASQAQHGAGNEPPAAVFKLSGYTLRIRSQPKRPHQFRLTHSSNNGNSPKKPLQFAAQSLDEMNGWIAALIKAIAVADELERVAAEAQELERTK